MQTEVNYPLKQKFNYVVPGAGEEEAQFITVKCPGMAHIKLTSVIRQLFTQALRENQLQRDSQLSKDEIDAEIEEDEADIVETEAPTLDAMQAMVMLEASSVDIQLVIDTCTKLFMSKRICLVDGEVPLTDHLIKQISIDDYYGMMGTLIGNFIVASLMS